jgi:hypothetical protein
MLINYHTFYNTTNISFENQEVILPKNSWFFIGSDGFEDQCNAERRKLGRKKMIELLEQYQNLKIYLLKVLQNKWKIH